MLAWLRFGLGALAMSGWIKRPVDELPMTGRTKWLVFLASLLGNFLFSICMLYGMSLTSAVSAGVIMASIPAVVAMLSWAFLGEKIQLRMWLAVACSALGMGLLSLSNSEQTMQTPQEHSAVFGLHAPAVGNFLIFAAVLCEAAYAVIGKNLTGRLGPKRIAALLNGWGLALATPFGFYLALDFNFKAVNTGIWLALVFYALAASVWTVWLWMTGLKQVPASQAGVFTVMLPVSATLVGVFILGEPVSNFQIGALAGTLVGIWLATVPSEGKNNVSE